MAESLTVLQLNERVRSILGTSSGVRDVWVSGEISNLATPSSGHYYFTLKDAQSEIQCTLFKQSRARMNFEPKNNMKVSVFGHVNIFVLRGQYQFNVENMRASGVGDLYLAYEELKKRLGAEGLFDESRKRKLPEFPMRVGVVTSPTGAVIHDILTVSKRRFPADILLYPALVQGEGAAASIARGIELLNREGVDVIIVGRGGGSIEDLWAFNEEIVARAIVSSNVPIVSAVGHETDFTIADFAADKRAPTPSAAAELVLPDKKDKIRHIDMLALRLARSLRSVSDAMKNRFRVLDAKLSPKRAGEKVEHASAVLNGLSSRASASLRSLMDRISIRFSVTDAKLSPRRAKESVDQYIMRVDDLSASVDVSVRRKIIDSGKDLTSLSLRLDSLNPSSVLGRGYAIIRSGGKTKTSVSGIIVGSEIEIMMRDGSASAEVKKVSKNE